MEYKAKRKEDNMKKTLGAIAAMTCVLAAGTAFAANPNYVKLSGKYTKVGDMEVTNQVELDSDEGYGFGAAIGRHIEWFKIEAEIATQESDINNFEVNGVSGRSFYSGDTRIDSLLLNAYFDVPVAGDWSVYAGGGAGAAIVTFSAYDYDIDETVFAYKFAAGVTYAFTDNFGTELGYEYLATEDIGYDHIEVKDIYSSNIVLSLKFMF
jgi:opacity protein-like surface antigen